MFYTDSNAVEYIKANFEDWIDFNCTASEIRSWQISDYRKWFG